MSPSTSEDQSFPVRLRKAREQKDLSQGELAERARFQPSAISHFETGRRSPSFENLRRLADALDVSTDYLLGREDEPATAGPVAQKLFRHAENLSKADLESLAEFAAILARRSKKR